MRLYLYLDGTWKADYMVYYQEHEGWAVIESRDDTDGNLADIIAFD